MKYLSLLFATLLFLSCKQHTLQTNTLFQIEQDGRVGFINSKGQTVIKPIFRSTGNFSEGLAPARLNGTYGYIDETGKWLIEPQFDYAIPFSEGLAIVYKDGVPFYINHKGEKAFDCHFKEIENFEHGRAFVKTATGKKGAIDQSGKLFIDTVFSNIGQFIEGLAVVEGLEDTAAKNNEIPYGVIDSTGKFIVPFGKYRSITDLGNDYFQVEIPALKNDTIEGYTAQTGFLDKTGKLVVAKSHQNNTYFYGQPKNGFIKTALYKYWIPKEAGTISTSDKSYMGFADLKGNIVINDTNYRSVTDFSNNRAFVEIRKGEWETHYSIINTKGKIVSNKSFKRVEEQGFVNGLAIVQTDWKWGVIDTNANFIIKPQFDEIARMGSYFVVSTFNGNYTSNNQYNYGIVKKNGQFLLKPLMQEYKRSGFKDSLLLCVIDNKLAYLHENGKIVWKQDDAKKKEQSQPLNLDYMNRGYFYATSAPNKNDLGGFGKSGNTASTILKLDSFPKNTFSVVVKTNATAIFESISDGLKVYVANTTNSPIQLNASDSRLYMKVQALNSKGEWADIEYLPSSWCGNSYHTLTLNSNEYWQFITPKYEGDFKTKLRISLSYIDPATQKLRPREQKELTIYSNEYEGSVNPGQFWRKGDYYPSNIMDPYTD